MYWLLRKKKYLRLCINCSWPFQDCFCLANVPYMTYWATEIMSTYIAFLSHCTTLMLLGNSTACLLCTVKLCNNHLHVSYTISSLWHFPRLLLLAELYHVMTYWEREVMSTYIYWPCGLLHNLHRAVLRNCQQASFITKYNMNILYVEYVRMWYSLW